MLKYLHNKIYAQNETMQEIIKVTQPELDQLEALQQQAFNNNFVLTSDIEGIERWERILNIVADINESIEFRRGRILNRLASNIPFTESFLRIIMNNLIGEGNWSYVLDYRNYQLKITSLSPGRDWLNEMKLTLDKIIPANILYFLDTFYQTWQAVYENHPNWQDVYDKYENWQDVMEAALIG